MTQGQASPAVTSRGTRQKGALVLMTRATIMQILARFCDEVKDEKDFSPFLDRIMEDLNKSGRDGEIAFDPKASEGARFHD